MQQSVKIGVAMFVVAMAQTAFAQEKAAIEAGSEVYQTNCSPCHGERLANPGGIPDLKKLGPEERPKFDAVVTDGRGQMPAWEGVLTDEQIGQVWAYIRSKAD